MRCNKTVGRSKVFFYVWMPILHHAVLYISPKHRKNWKGIGRRSNGKMYRENSSLAHFSPLENENRLLSKEEQKRDFGHDCE